MTRRTDFHFALPISRMGCGPAGIKQEARSPGGYSLRRIHPRRHNTQNDILAFPQSKCLANDAWVGFHLSRPLRITLNAPTWINWRFKTFSRPCLRYLDTRAD